MFFESSKCRRMFLFVDGGGSVNCRSVGRSFVRSFVRSSGRSVGRSFGEGLTTNAVF